MLRENDNAAQAQFDYTVPGAGAPGVWVRLGMLRHCCRAGER